MGDIATELLIDEPVADPEIAGVRLSRYASVQALLDAGIPFDEVLVDAGIAASRWPEVERAWRLALIDDSAMEQVLIAASDHHAELARQRVERRVPPLEEDWRAWITFFRAFTTSRDPLAFLEQRGVTTDDILRLQFAWQDKLEADENLRELYARTMDEPLGAVPDVHPEPPRLRKRSA
jgi:hypothetical protein